MGTNIGYVRRTGNKPSVHTHLNHLVIVSPPFTPSAASASATVRNLVATRAPDDAHEITKAMVFDLENKPLAYSGTFGEGLDRSLVSGG
jgi:vacuolar protein sorting-associated protein 11